jgi:hypothetical protein
LSYKRKYKKIWQKPFSKFFGSSRIKLKGFCFYFIKEFTMSIYIFVAEIRIDAESAESLLENYDMYLNYEFDKPLPVGIIESE